MARFKEAPHRPANPDKKPPVVKEKLQLCKCCHQLKVYRKVYGMSVCRDCLGDNFNEPPTDETCDHNGNQTAEIPKATPKYPVSSVGRRGSYRR